MRTIPYSTATAALSLRVYASAIPFVQAAFSALLIVAASGCTKVEPDTPLSCRVANGGVGIGGIANARNVMFWADQTMANNRLHLLTIRNTETNGAQYGRLSSADMMGYFTTKPACGTYGPVVVALSKGYEYEYTFACASRQFVGKVTVDCSGDDCVAVQLR